MWVIGGRQARRAGVADLDHRVLYDRGVVAHVTADGLRDVRLVTTVRCLKGVAPDGRWLCSEGALLGFDPVTGRVEAPTAVPGGDPLDLHHALGRRRLAVTGRDEVWWDGEVHVLAKGSHPNHLFVVDRTPWVTCGARGRAQTLDGDQSWPLADVVVHDGVVRPDGVWFTAVDGRLVRLDPESGHTDQIDLADLDVRAPPLGWCRGLAFVDGLAWVGFTRLRATATRQRLAWVRGALRGRPMASRHPTRLVAYDLSSGHKVREIELEAHGLNALFGIHSRSPT